MLFAKTLQLDLALSLLVFRIFADHADRAFSLDDFTFFANRFHGRSNLHLFHSFRKKSAYYYNKSGQEMQEQFPIFKQFFMGFLGRMPTGRDFLRQPLPVSYLSLQIMRPFVRSYGDNSSVTLSPGTIFIKFMRSLPLICASTR